MFAEFHGYKYPVYKEAEGKRFLIRFDIIDKAWFSLAT
jgi:hypothetical protein